MNSRPTPRAAYSGATGVELRRGPLSDEDALLTPDHYQLVAAGTQLSLLGDVRQSNHGGVLELRAYRDTRDGSTTLVSEAVPVGSFENCVAVRLNMVAPAGTVAVQPLVRLGPPQSVQGVATLLVDNVRVAAWADEGAAGPRWRHVESVDGTPLELTAVEGTPWL